MSKYASLVGDSLSWHKTIQNIVKDEYDVIICGWADKDAIFLSNKERLARKQIMYVRSYELFSGLFDQVNHKAFDHTVFVNKYFRDLFYPTAQLIYNGIDLDQFPLQDHIYGCDIAVVANVNHKKGITLLASLAASTSDYTFHIAGQVQEPRYGYYLQYLNIPNIKYCGYVKDVPKFLADKDYILSTSPAEGNPNNIIEAMALGISPIINDWMDSKNQFPKEHIFRTLEDFESILNYHYDPKENRQWVADRYEYKKIYSQLWELFK